MSPEKAPSSTRRAVILRATAREVVGAGMRVAGLTVVDRSIKQLDRMGITIVVASDGSCALPKYLPPSAMVRRVPRPEEMSALRKELPGVLEIGADEVRPVDDALAGGIKVYDEASRRKAESAIFARLLRGDLGLVARHLNKPISFFLTRHLLCRLPIRPNHVTIMAGLIGLAGCVLMATGSRVFLVWGLLLAHVQSILDGCDGELARVRLQQSHLGEWLDTMVDDGLNILIFAALGIGFYRATGRPLLLGAGLIAAGMHLLYDAIAVSEIFRQGRGGETITLRWWLTGSDDMKSRLHSRKKGTLSRLYTMGRRDFFVLAFLIYALLGVGKLALVHALLIAGTLLVIAVAQIIWRLRGSR